MHETEQTSVTITISHQMTNSSEFPRIDLTPFLQEPFPSDADFPSPQQLAVARTVDDCFRGVGILLVQNATVTNQTLKAINRISNDLFLPPDDVKTDTLLPMLAGTNMGYLPFCTEGLNSERGPDIKETYNFMFGQGIKQDFRGCPPTFRETAKQFWDSMTITARTLCVICAVALNLPYDYFIAALKKNESTTVRILHYPPCKLPSPEINKSTKGAIRAGEHTDFGLFTFLFTDGPGLQARENSSSEFESRTNGVGSGWIDVPEPEGTDSIVVLGALMSRWTNDTWPAAAHRVIVDDEQAAKKDRLTIACFFQPDPDFIVSVHPRFVENEEKPKYDPITAKEYLLSRLRQANAYVSSSRTE